MLTICVTFQVSRARPLSERAVPQLVTRLKHLNVAEPENAVKLILRYIRDVAPIIIHFNCDLCMSYFIKDTHYRNQVFLNCYFTT